MKAKRLLQPGYSNRGKVVSNIFYIYFICDCYCCHPHGPHDPCDKMSIKTTTRNVQGKTNKTIDKFIDYTERVTATKQM